MSNFSRPLIIVSMKFIWSLLLCLVFSTHFGQENQEVNTLISEFKEELHQKEIENYFIIKHQTNGHLGKYTDESCDYNFTLYAFWQTKETTWLQKKNLCNTYKPIDLQSNSSIIFVEKHLSKLKKEEVHVYKIKPDTVENGVQKVFIATKPNTPLRVFWFHFDDAQFTKDFDTFDTTNEGEVANVNYAYNNQLAIIQLNKICDNIIYQLEQQRLFEPLR
ncbi:MAG: hypothetical protein ACQESK_10115 [Bacteroidota bacterium]